MSARLLLLTVLISQLIGCSWFTEKVKPVVIDTKPQEKVKLNLPEPEPLKLNKVEWVVITPDNVQKEFEKMQKSKIDVVLFGLTDTDYENLSLNMSKIRSYLIKQRQIINSYKSYYEPSKENSTP